MSINRRMDKKYVVHTDNGTLVSHKKERNWISFVVMCMNLESVIQSEVSQKDKNKVY